MPPHAICTLIRGNLSQDSRPLAEARDERWLRAEGVLDRATLATAQADSAGRARLRFGFPAREIRAHARDGVWTADVEWSWYLEGDPPPDYGTVHKRFRSPPQRVRAFELRRPVRLAPD